MRTLTLLLLMLSTQLTAQNVDIPDANFKSALISLGVDTNNDGIIQTEEAETTETLVVSEKQIADLTGVQAFVNLVFLECERNEFTEIDLRNNVLLETFKCGYNSLAALDITSLTRLKLLECYNNNLTELNLEFCTELERMNVDSNELDEIDLSKNLKLNWIAVRRNNLEKLDVSNNIEIETLLCAGNRLTDLDIGRLAKLSSLNCSSNFLSELDLSQNNLLTVIHSNFNQLTEIDVAHLSALNILSIYDNFISEIDLSNNTNLSSLNVHNMNLTELDLSNNALLDLLQCSNNEIVSLDLSNQRSLVHLDAFMPGLQYLNLVNDGEDIIIFNLKLDSITPLSICVDTQEEANGIQNTFTVNENLDRLSFLLDCTFPLEFLSFTNEFNGTVRYDDSGTCSQSSRLVENVLGFELDLEPKALRTENVDIGGVFSFGIPAGDYEISTLINDYAFKVSPEFLEVSIGENEVLNQDFCISPGASKVIAFDFKIIPVGTPRPGFDCEYQLIYENRGNVAVDGKVVFEFDPTLLSFVDSSPELTIANGVMFYDFEALPVLAKDVVDITLRLNSPMDTPALNNGDVLQFRGFVDGLESTRKAWDYTYLEQVVVNSYDPNDKRCLQGTAILDTTIGEYLDYMIRFENTGTAEAVNISIKDKIDTTVFDLSSLRTVDSSHEVETYIEADEVTFLFSDIYLPFEDDTNDGYVVFEIRTLDNLVLSDEVSNTADIFLDFNFPIVTNTYRSEVVTDADGDGFHNLQDCDDSNPMIYPGAIEVAGNLIDEDCDMVLLSSIGKVTENFPVRIYPNPASSILYLESIEVDKNFAFSMYDLNGTLLLTKTKLQNIEVGDYPAGIYFLQLVDNTSRTYYEKIIIN